MTNDAGALPTGCRIVLDPPTGTTADLLAAAFADEPGIRWTCGPDRTHQRAWFAATERLLARQPAARRYLLQQDGRPVAAAWVTTPGRPPLTAALGWLGRVLTGCGPAAVTRTAAYRRNEEPLVPPRATILEFVGVLQEARGSGLGGILLQRVLADALARHDCPPVHLSTADPHNVGLYRHLRFEVDGTFSLPGLQVTAMSRATGTSTTARVIRER